MWYLKDIKKTLRLWIYIQWTSVMLPCFYCLFSLVLPERSLNIDQWKDSSLRLVLKINIIMTLKRRNYLKKIYIYSILLENRILWKSDVWLSPDGVRFLELYWICILMIQRVRQRFLCVFSFKGNPFKIRVPLQDKKSIKILMLYSVCLKFRFTSCELRVCKNYHMTLWPQWNKSKQLT